LSAKTVKEKEKAKEIEKLREAAKDWALCVDLFR